MIGWSLFALILSIVNSGASLEVSLGQILGFLGLAFFAIYLGDKYKDRVPPHQSLARGLIELIAITMLVTAIVAEASGTHGIFGAFLAGVVLSQVHGRKDQILGRIYPLVIGLLAPIYFVSIGLKANFVTNFDGGIVLLILIVVCIGKILGAWLGARTSDIITKDALAIGFGMNARGAMEIALASAALDYHLIDKRIFVALVIMALATTLIGGSMLERLTGIKPDHIDLWGPEVPPLIHEIPGSYNFFES